MEEKININYDEEFDDLLLYREEGKKNYKFTITLADFVIDLSETGKVVGIEILEAKKTIGSLIGQNITNDLLKNMKSAKIFLTIKGSAMYIRISIISKNDKILNIPLVVPSAR